MGILKGSWKYNDQCKCKNFLFSFVWKVMDHRSQKRILWIIFLLLWKNSISLIYDIKVCNSGILETLVIKFLFFNLSNVNGFFYLKKICINLSFKYKIHIIFLLHGLKEKIYNSQFCFLFMRDFNMQRNFIIYDQCINVSDRSTIILMHL